MITHNNIILKKNNHWINPIVSNISTIEYRGNADLWPHVSGMETSTIGYPKYIKVWATFNRDPGGLPTVNAHSCIIEPRVTLSNRTVDITNIAGVGGEITNNSALSNEGGFSTSNVIEFTLNWDAIEAYLSPSNRLPLNIGYVTRSMAPGYNDIVYGTIYTICYNNLHE